MTTELDVAAPAERARFGVRRRSGVWSLPEVRWAAVATALFLLGLAARLSGGPDWLWWGLHLACKVCSSPQPPWGVSFSRADFKTSTWPASSFT